MPAGASPLLRRLMASLFARLGSYRAPRTWAAYVGPWRRAWAWCAPQLALLDERPALTVAGLARFPAVAHSYAQLLRERGTGLHAVCTACTAINFAMTCNQQPDIMNDFPAKMLRECVRREDGRPPKKMHELREPALRKLVDRWGFGRDAGRRQLALMAALGRALLGRFSDLCWLQVEGIIFLPEGVLFCVPRRKNLQYGKFSWLPLADSGHARSTVALLRLHLTALGYTVPQPTAAGGRVAGGPGAPLGAFLLRPWVRVGGHTQWHKARWQLGVGAHPLHTGEVRVAQGYNAALQLLRAGLQVCCGFSKADAAGFGTQSFRRGGDTALFEGDVPQERRQLLGMWRSQTTELSYIGYTARQHLAWARTSAL